MKKFVIKTLGCKTNQLESALICENLTDNGYEEVQDIRNADYYILNSCSVTQIADSKNLACLRRAKRENPQVTIVLTGCMAQLEKDNIIKNNIADFVIGNNEKTNIALILAENNKLNVSDIFAQDKFQNKILRNAYRTRASVKIQDGCNNRCSYCTIPFARGKSRSNSIGNIIEQINLFVEEGYYETVLTGIHIGQWGMDFENKQNLIDLLKEIEKTDIRRYRLGSLNPLELPKDFIDFLANSKKFCPHFHLSLQSVCDKTLKAMNRNYSEIQIKELVDYINLKFTNAFIGSDIIAGFPNETDEDFQITYNHLKDLSLSKIHVFPYSRRKGTKADLMQNQIDINEKKKRVSLIQNISDKKLNEFFTKNINTQNEVIIEKNRDKKTNLLKGVTKNYINVLINGNDNLKDTVQKIKLKSIYEDGKSMLGEIVS